MSQRERLFSLCFQLRFLFEIEDAVLIVNALNRPRLYYSITETAELVLNKTAILWQNIGS